LLKYGVLQKKEKPPFKEVFDQPARPVNVNHKFKLRLLLGSGNGHGHCHWRWPLHKTKDKKV
jgi:hypothetical protein